MALLLLMVFASHCQGAAIMPDSSVTLRVPDGWDSVHRDFSGLTPPSVAGALDCVDANPSELTLVGWKLDESGVVEGAYCVSFRKNGMGRALNILKTSQGKEKEEAAAKFTDTFAGVIMAGYSKRKMKVVDMSADLINAGKDVVMVLDGKIRDTSGEYIRSATVYLHNDSMLSINSVYKTTSPVKIADQLDAIPVSVEWRK